jgi:hypothetical protein
VLRRQLEVRVSSGARPASRDRIAAPASGPIVNRGQAWRLAANGLMFIEASMHDPGFVKLAHPWAG